MTRIALAGLVAVAVGCETKPSAPPLSPEAVYRNDAAGLRFLTPDGWTPAAKTNPPPGPLGKPTRLVGYVTGAAKGQAQAELYAFDLPADTDLIAYLLGKETRIGPMGWKVKAGPTAATINGAAATTYELREPDKKSETRRDLVAFRRGGRVYLFVYTAPDGDTPTLGAFQRMVASAQWDDPAGG
jgi:hypothetical protein